MGDVKLPVDVLCLGTLLFHAIQTLYGYDIHGQDHTRFFLLARPVISGPAAIIINNNNYYIGGRLYLNLFKSVQSAAGLKAFEDESGGRITKCSLSGRAFL